MTQRQRKTRNAERGRESEGGRRMERGGEREREGGEGNGALQCRHLLASAEVPGLQPCMC